MSVTIKTNNKPRQMIYGHQLTEQERKEFYYIAEDEIDSHNFFRFKGSVYDLSEFMRVTSEELQGWDGYSADSYFSGVVIKCINDDEVIVGRYYS